MKNIIFLILIVGSFVFLGTEKQITVLPTIEIDEIDETITPVRAKPEPTETTETFTKVKQKNNVVKLKSKIGNVKIKEDDGKTDYFNNQIGADIATYKNSLFYNIKKPEGIYLAENKKGKINLIAKGYATNFLIRSGQLFFVHDDFFYVYDIDTRVIMKISKLENNIDLYTKNKIFMGDEFNSSLNLKAINYNGEKLTFPKKDIGYLKATDDLYLYFGNEEFMTKTDFDLNIISKNTLKYTIKPGDKDYHACGPDVGGNLIRHKNFLYCSTSQEYRMDLNTYEIKLLPNLEHFTIIRFYDDKMICSDNYSENMVIFDENGERIKKLKGISSDLIYINNKFYENSGNRIKVYNKNFKQIDTIELHIAD